MGSSRLVQGYVILGICASAIVFGCSLLKSELSPIVFMFFVEATLLLGLHNNAVACGHLGGWASVQLS